MTATVYDLTGVRAIEQGATWSLGLTLKAGGVAMDLTGYTVRGQVRQSYGSATATAIACAVTSAAEGAVSLSLTAEQTAALGFRGGVYDVELVGPTPSTAVRRLLMGAVEVSPEVTRG